MASTSWRRGVRERQRWAGVSHHHLFLFLAPGPHASSCRPCRAREISEPLLTPPPPTTVIANLQDKENGTFSGDEWGEEDTRFVYGAFNALSLLGLLHLADVDRAVAHIVACANFDGGYGVTPGAESHSGQIFTCVAALAIAGRLDLVDADRLGRWLSERQTPGGGLNGRPEKQEDSCYSWWVLSSLQIIGRVHWIDRDALVKFILRCQDTEGGGIADRPGDMVDVWHTCFGMTGLSLLEYPGTVPVDPVYCMPRSTIERVLGKTY